ncbi:MAG: YkgJ family cysteine cluster protein [Roseburia sp.]|nr:YkgJ family cysteine cluster protein [Roseburia sp.]MCM1096782.1 YkgJ family cysteine cluster protein [Ruminococcus flavefaciens]
MKRNVSLEEISDGRLYGYQDMVRADCHGCQGCHKCCAGMGNSVVLDPYDAWRLQEGLGLPFATLLDEGKIELHVVDGCILPNLAMNGREEACAFLDEGGRCSIHAYRPGICRLFPLGRYYEDGDFRFFLQTGECAAKNRTKIKASKWLDTPRQAENHRFLCAWHQLLKEAEEAVSGREDSEAARELNLGLLTVFYFSEPSRVDFYEDFEVKLELFRKKFMI